MRQQTTTELTAEEIHQIGLDDLERIHAEMHVTFDQLGFLEDENLTNLYKKVERQAGYARGDEIISGFEELIEEVESRLDEYFDIKPHEMAYVGDYLYDIQAGNSAGVKTILIASEETKGQWGPMANYVASDLGEVLDIMITGRR